MQNNSNDIIITILENGTDIENSIPVMTREIVKKKHWTERLRSISRAIIMIVCLLNAAAAVLYSVEGSVGMTIVYTVSTVLFFLFFLALGKWEKKRKIVSRENCRQVRLTSYPGKYYPKTYRFTDDSITVITSGNRSSTGYKSINYITESDEGIHISLAAPLAALNIWLPARFVSKADYDRLSALLREKAGRKYTVVWPLNTPEQAETVEQEAEFKPQGEKKTEFSYKYGKAVIVRDMFRNLYRRNKNRWLPLIALIIAFVFSGFLRDIVGTGKLIIKIARLIAKYTELGQVISQADIIDTFQSLIITFTGVLFSASILIYIALCAYYIIYNVVYIAREYIVAKPMLDEGYTITIYDDCIEEKNGDFSHCVMPWDTVRKATIKLNTRLSIYGTRGIKFMLPLSSLGKEQKDEIFENLTSRLGRSWNKPQSLPAPAADRVYNASTYSSNEKQ